MGKVWIRILMPNDLRRKFKTWCSKNGKNMTDIIIKIIRELVESEG